MPTSAVIQASVAEHGLVTTHLEVTYEYKVDGRYYGGCYATRVFNFSAETLVTSLPSRSAALVHYDPRRPNRSLLVDTVYRGHQPPSPSVELLKPAGSTTGA